jgi:hypothetical protein
MQSAGIAVGQMPQPPKPPARLRALSFGPRARIPALASAPGHRCHRQVQHGIEPARRASACLRGIVARGPLPRAAASLPVRSGVDNDDCRARRGERRDVASARFAPQATSNSQFVTCLGVDRDRSDGRRAARNRRTRIAPSAAGLTINMRRSLRINRDTLADDTILARAARAAMVHVPDEELFQKRG